ncbi:MAG: hypothetical protein H7A38_00475 [Chlamydiales bacterium]|nr:hypothetical protein [Chlamydiales bacterium]
MEKLAGESHAGYSQDVDIEDAQIVAQLLKRHKDRQLPGASLFDEILAALLTENHSLRADLKARTVAPLEPSTTGGMAHRVLTSQTEIQQKKYLALEPKVQEAIGGGKQLQSEGEALKGELLSLFRAKFPHSSSLPLEEALIPPKLQHGRIDLSDEQKESPLEVQTVEYYQMIKKIEHGEKTLEYYANLPEQVELLREALALAREDRWSEMIEEPPVEVVSDLTIENARLKKEVQKNTSLQGKLDAANDKIAAQSLEMQEMRAEINLLKRQLAGANRVIEDQALHSWK